MVLNTMNKIQQKSFIDTRDGVPIYIESQERSLYERDTFIMARRQHKILRNKSSIPDYK